jgi:hypothetical protein
MSFPSELETFVNNVQWTFARTYAKTWPHEYIVRDRVNEALFEKLCRYIRANSYEGRFYKMTINYFDADCRTYWDMGSKSPEETVIINRCLQEQSYETRLAKGTLPEESLAP